MDSTRAQLTLTITAKWQPTDALEQLFYMLERSWVRSEPLPEGLAIAGFFWTSARVVDRGTAEAGATGEIRITYTIEGFTRATVQP